MRKAGDSQRIPSGSLAVGVGFRTAATAAEIEALVLRVLAGYDGRNARLFTLDAKADHPGLRTAAARLGLPLTGLPADLLARQEAVTIRSPRAAATVGTRSVAEAAALAGAGPGARLVVPRVVAAGVTCAMARPCAGADHRTDIEETDA